MKFFDLYSMKKILLYNTNLIENLNFVLEMTKLNEIKLHDVSQGVTQSILLITSMIKLLLLLNMARMTKNYLISFITSHVIYCPTPILLTYAGSFGSLAGITLVIQMISGIFLSMHYTPNIDLAFNSKEYIMRDVKNGWLLRR